MTLFKKIFFPSRFGDRTFSAAIKTITGFTPKDLDLYHLALRHSSSIKSKDHKRQDDNQRLEFLGDAILGAIVAEYLYQKFPNKDEGFLTNVRSKIVSRKSLNEISKNLDIPKLLVKKLDKNKPAHSIYGDAFEAIIGALYLDRGINATKHFIEQKIIETFWDDKSLESHVISYKSALIEWAQKEKHSFKFYVLKEFGERHNLTFEVAFLLNDNEIATGIGSSKKRAEENAAQKSYTILNI